MCRASITEKQCCFNEAGGPSLRGWFSQGWGFFGSRTSLQESRLRSYERVELTTIAPCTLTSPTPPSASLMPSPAPPTILHWPAPGHRRWPLRFSCPRIQHPGPLAIPRPPRPHRGRPAHHEHRHQGILVYLQSRWFPLNRDPSRCSRGDFPAGWRGATCRRKFRRRQLRLHRPLCPQRDALLHECKLGPTVQLHQHLQ
jgi:hypothetical protein